MTMPTAPTGAGQLYAFFGGSYFVDTYNGTLAINVNGTLTTIGLSPPASFTAANTDTIEVIYTNGFAEVWSTHSGTRTLINSYYLGRTYVNGTTCGLLGKSTSATVSNFILRY
jgi:hypothetical protein